MAKVEVRIDRGEIQRPIHCHHGRAGLVEQVLNQILDAEIRII